MAMKGVLCCAGVMLLACALPVRAADSQKQTYVIGAEVSAMGEVTKTQPEPGVTRPIAAVLDLALKHWRFVPARKYGRAVPAHTFITATLESISDAKGKYTLTVRYISQGPRWEHSNFPVYSPEALQIHALGSVEATAELQADGKLIIKDSRTSAAGRPGRLLTNGVDDALQHDRYTPETLDGKPVSAHLRTRIVFSQLDRQNSVTTTRCKAAPYSIPIWCQESRDDNAPPTAAERAFLEQTGFVVGTGDNRTWRPGISSVLQPSVINPITMRL
jgi:hypothetical protein